ncbi:DUF952 domain-containing protein [Candidatus Wolfebacteria bacterium]|nr:DUF952 domain-containing protein [Candidatus Wolfebacteria bacterium]
MNPEQHSIHEAEKNPKIIIHICPREDLEAALRSGQYQANSLTNQGFIHCSTPEQIGPIRDFLLKQNPGIEFVTLEIDSSRLHAKVKYAGATGESLYPHVYGPINTEAVVAVRAVEK